MCNFKEYEIIDAHTHVFPAKIAEKASNAIGDFYKAPMEYNGSSDELIKSGSKIGVSKYLICSAATTADQTTHINNFIISECESHNEFIGFGTLHPHFDDLENETKKIVDNNLKGIKLHPDFQKFDIDDNVAYNIYELAQAYDLPILFHTGDDRYEYSRPHKLLQIIKDFPKIKIIAAHFGGYQCWQEAINTIAKKENVMFDTSSTIGFVPIEYAKKIANKFDKERLFFGTDFPMWNHETELNRFFKLGFSYEDNQKILSKNFKKYFNL